MESSSDRLIKPEPISGFPEWLPEARLVEQRFMDIARRVFESYGYCNLQTPLVERLDILLAKGGAADKEIYALQRVQSEERGDTEAKLGLRFDLTVPMARYVAQHFNDLVFPFKRYQIQSCYRGERPQEGRFREFYQADIDVVNVDEIPLSFDYEIPLVVCEVLGQLGIGQFQLRISNRKILHGYLQGLGVTDVVSVTRVLDKFDKIGERGVVQGLAEDCSLSPDVAKRAVALASIQSSDASFVAAVSKLGVKNELMQAGLDELAYVMSALHENAPGMAIADLSIARGLDYYTGSVYEVKWLEFPDVGSIGSGGRYDNLTGSFINKHIPGTGMSIGLSRIFAKLVTMGRVTDGPLSPAQILVTWLEDGSRNKAEHIARTLRNRGFNVETYFKPDKLKKQLRYASRKKIPFVWLELDGEVKDMTSGEQKVASPETWSPNISTPIG